MNLSLFGLNFKHDLHCLKNAMSAEGLCWRSHGSIQPGSVNRSSSQMGATPFLPCSARIARLLVQSLRSCIPVQEAFTGLHSPILLKKLTPPSPPQRLCWIVSSRQTGCWLWSNNEGRSLLSRSGQWISCRSWTNPWIIGVCWCFWVVCPSDTAFTLVRSIWIWFWEIINSWYLNCDFKNLHFLSFSHRLCILSIPGSSDTACLWLRLLLLNTKMISSYTPDVSYCAIV